MLLKNISYVDAIRVRLGLLLFARSVESSGCCLPQAIVESLSASEAAARGDAGCLRSSLDDFALASASPV